MKFRKMKLDKFLNDKSFQKYLYSLTKSSLTLEDIYNNKNKKL